MKIENLELDKCIEKKDKLIKEKEDLIKEIPPSSLEVFILNFNFNFVTNKNFLEKSQDLRKKAENQQNIESPPESN